MSEKLKITITNKTGRLDKLLSERLIDYSRTQIQSWLKGGLIFSITNQQVVKPNYKVKDIETFEIQIPEVQELEILPEDMPIDIIYEDKDVAVVNKPQGMVVHPSAGHPSHTLVNALLYHLKDLSSINGVIRPGIVHRIDKDTTGLLMIAKNDMSHESLAKQLKAKTSLRKYVALVHGVIPHDKGTINAPIGRSKQDRKKQAVVADGKDAVTHFTVLERFDQFTLIECKLETGRTHQIRVHMQYIGYPLAGDPIYGPKITLKANGQFLHARDLGFEHPTTGEWLEFTCPLPEIFSSTLNKLRKENI